MRNEAMILMNLTASALLVAVACGHTHSVGDAPTSTNTHTTPPIDQTTRARSAAATESRGGGGASNGGVVNGTGRDGAPPLATSPAGLLKPHAIESIQEKLASNGRLSGEHETGKLDEPTREALREFQRSQNLPATGMPDDVTIQRLGLATDDIFRASEEPAKDAPGANYK